MDMPDFPSGRSPRRELQLQGPRPAPLKVRKDSHKIRKPPVAPPPAAQAHHQPPHHAPRPPVVIYTVSPKIIHANPNEFMSLVQRLTGPTPTSPSPSTTSSSAYAFQESGGAVSPAARFASIERTKSPRKTMQSIIHHDQDQETDQMIVIETRFPGILSPNPNSLPPLIPPNFFSLPSDNFFQDLSPVLHSSRSNYLENSFLLQSPSTYIPSPNTLDLFHSLFDLQ